uniref:G-protein coupled receptors family 1 profile domain-containing protein n=2 Tax=Lepisosteus oculatus TaxID=7918 RepID=W5NMY4_LEPOC
MDLMNPVLLVLRYLISIVGIIGNITLVVSILSHSHMKTFEIFLLGLSFSNLEGIFLVSIFDITTRLALQSLEEWSFKILRFMASLGETATIFFTVLISVFRYQKLRHAEARGNLPTSWDNTSTAWALSGMSLFLSFCFCLPGYFIESDERVDNHTRSRNFLTDPFQCPRINCPAINLIYKTLFLLFSNLIPLLIITATSGLILKVLLHRRKTVSDVYDSSHHHHQNLYFSKSTKTVLAAMCIFQLDWIMYLVLHLAFDSSKMDNWSEIEFFIVTTYTTISPYVYGIGTNIFSCRQIVKV